MPWLRGWRLPKLCRRLVLSLHSLHQRTRDAKKKGLLFEKRSKNFCEPGYVLGQRHARNPESFWFFLSKKNRFLCPLPNAIKKGGHKALPSFHASSRFNQITSG
jgi:hypothetical protein